MHVVDQVLSIFAVTKGYMDDVPIKKARLWETQFLAFMKEQKPELRNELKRDRKISDSLEGKLKAAISEFKPQFKG
jgi:F-type H+-transporting ATPase subunit alpha